MKKIWFAFLALVVLSACSQSGTPDSGTSTPSPGFTDTLPNTTVVTTTTFEPTGTIVVDGNGRPLYVYIPDKDSEISTCTDLCPTVYAPLMADDSVVAKGGLDDNLIGVGGDGQVLYNGHLLYTFTGDTADTTPTGVTPDFFLIAADGSVKGSA